MDKGGLSLVSGHLSFVIGRGVIEIWAHAGELESSGGLVRPEAGIRLSGRKTGIRTIDYFGVTTAA
jgi:hypothetical protein